MPRVMITWAANSTPIIGDAHHGERGAQEALSHPYGEQAAEQHAGDGADQDVAGEQEVDVAADPVRDPGRPEEHRSVEDVRADHALGDEPEDRDQRDRDQGARPGRGQPDHEPVSYTHLTLPTIY